MRRLERWRVYGRRVILIPSDTFSDRSVSRRLRCHDTRRRAVEVDEGRQFLDREADRLR